MAVSTAIFNQDVQNPIAYAQDIVAKQQEQEAAASAAAAKRSTANSKQISDMMKVGEDWGVKFREPLMGRVSGFREKIKAYAVGGGDANDPQFQQWYAENKAQLVSDAQKGKYIEEFIADTTKAIDEDPYRDLDQWQESFYKQFQYPNGEIADPNDIDLEAMERSKNDMTGYLVDKAGEDFVKNSESDVMDKIIQNNLQNGMVAISREEIQSKLYEVDPVTGMIVKDTDSNMPKIKMSDEWVANWNSDPDRQRWLDQTMENITGEGKVPARGTTARLALQKRILEPVLRPYAVHEQETKNFSVRNIKEPGKETASQRSQREKRENTMLFTDSVREYQRGDSFNLIESNPRVESIERTKEGTDIVEMKNGDTVVIDHTKPDGDYQKIYNLASWPGRKPSAKELDEAAKTEGEAGAISEKVDTALQPQEIEEFKVGKRGEEELIGSRYNGKEIKDVKVSKTTRWFTPNEFEYELTLSDGSKAKLGFADAKNYENLQMKGAGKAAAPQEIKLTPGGLDEI